LKNFSFLTLIIFQKIFTFFLTHLNSKFKEKDKNGKFKSFDIKINFAMVFNIFSASKSLMEKI